MKSLISNNNHTSTDESLHEVTEAQSTTAPSAKQIDGWADPVPLDTFHQEGRPYPLEALSPWHEALVREISERIGVPVAMAAQSIQSAMSYGSQGLVNVVRPTESGELLGPVSTGHLTLADSSERKSSCDDAVMAFLRPEEERIRQKYTAKYNAAVAEHEIWLEEYTSRKKLFGKLLSQAESDVKVAEQVLELQNELSGLKLNEPFKPPERIEDFLPKLFVQNFTSQALGRSLAKYPSGIISSAEGAQVLGGYSFQKDSVLSTLAALNELIWSGNMRNDRIGDTGIDVQNSRLSVNIMIQPSAAQDAFNNPLFRGTGFLARLCLAHPVSRAGSRFIDPQKALKSRKKNENCLDQFQIKLRSLLHLVRLNPAGQLELINLSMDNSAKKIWIEYYNQIEKELGDGGQFADFRDVAGKSAEIAARLAAQSHVLRHVQPRPLDQEWKDSWVDEGRSALDQPISKDDVESGIEIARWHLEEFMRVYGCALEDQPIKDAQVVLNWLRDHQKASEFRNGKDLAIRILQQSGTRPVCRKRERLMEALSILEQANYLRLEENTKSIRSNPKGFHPN